MNDYSQRGNVKRPYVTIVLAALNVIVFILLTARGMTEDPEYMLGHGAMYMPYILEFGEYYRMAASLFLHFGFEHLMNNMVILVLTGSTLEMEVGRIRFLLIYLAAGLCGNAASAAWDIYTGNYTVSAGASGAIFGLIGALLYVVIRNKGQLGTLTGRGVLFMIVLMLYYGFTSGGVDNLAHIGGLVSGFVLAVLLYRKRKSKFRAARS